ncbi:tetratricopeptide repeat-containing protein [Maudiozyma humilis]|uniref:Tetratricopeptide repeat-containing protein n=1 Tax=Maudiozyma humilis TaxID=51915 RepID=A0AAV5S2E2_MAUHU|nr:tetratricopeptide repeat-containing protein [Kazachstania humilis]
MELLLHTHVLLASDKAVLAGLEGKAAPEATFASQLLGGNNDAVAQDTLVQLGQKIDASAAESPEALVGLTREFLAAHFGPASGNSQGLFLAIALLQCFIQNNCTGPAIETDILDLVYAVSSAEEKTRLQSLLVQSLTILGQPAYELMASPECLVLSLLLLELLTMSQSLFGDNIAEDIAAPEFPEGASGLVAVANWWRARALLAHLSVVPEPSGNQPAVAAGIMSSVNIAQAIANQLPAEVGDDLKRRLFTIYYLENAKVSLAINTEHLCLPALTKAKKLTEFQFVLTGARARRTKFQQTGHSGLIILAASAQADEAASAPSQNPEAFQLESDLLLEKPVFDAIGAEPLDEQIVKRQKVDPDAEVNQGIDEDRLLPMALRQEYIPQVLQALDPNEQPALNNLDVVQLLLRLYVIRQTSPAKDPLVEEELGSIVSRVIYQHGHANWSLFSRALWERSILETNKAKTVERGLLQMQSLVEELALKIQTRLIPQNADADENDGSHSSAPRLKYIHQLPFIPRWELDASLAEKYMSLGVLRSAVEIYDRLHMVCEAALCYAAVGDEKEGEAILVKRISECPSDARALSILGDIRQDPALWEKSWAVGKYVNAKNSLARYYYRPPKDSGLTLNYDVVLGHLNDSLRQYPLSFDTWYFYGCVALECEKLGVAAEAFSRCVSLDETHSMAWSNLSAAYIRQDKLKEAFSCLKRAVGFDAQKNWRIWENFMIVSFRLQEWNDVLTACKQLVGIKRDKQGEGSVDLPVVEKLVELLVSTEYKEDSAAQDYFQRTCIEFVCVTLPTVITTSARLWKLVAKAELWRRRPWAALECHERAYRATLHNPAMETEEPAWDETVDACEDLVAAYESLGEREGRHGPGSVVCRDWKYKARSTVKALMSKGRGRWDGSAGWERLMEARSAI